MISIIRGDTKHLKFKRVNKQTGEIVKNLPDKMYFTVKYNYNFEDFLIQKTLNDGITFDENSGYYSLTINPDDTNNLQYGKYVFDIEIIINDTKTTIAKDEIIIEEEVTFASNES